ncbi:hypothetical protein BT96DRAFT_867733 [Gymnopus androsaceus JB14]|uniref:DUF6534 domain-containing protein n=1 Tax=Gymnopus androsaceus JB14 TaxID=1447944 RepID=A0A6A4GNK2_9AGAR|nr:hypothetical protein BT96DRAFT_867733 [Gymnopus androsaceus JB14]
MTTILAPFYWGTVVSFILSGITLLQAYKYFPSRDRKGVQLVALIMVLLDTASTALCAEGMYVYVIPHFGSLLPLGSLTLSLSIDCYVAVIITFISQMYFAWFVSRLSSCFKDINPTDSCRQIYTVSGAEKRRFRRLILPGIVTLLAHVAFFGGIACSTIMIVDKTMILANRSFRFAVAVGIAKGAAALADIIATVSLCCLLSSARTGFKRTDSLVKRLMAYVVQRGIAVTLIQVMFLVLFYGTSQHLYWLALHVNMTRLYANTFFAMLNGRDRLKHGSSEASSTFFISADRIGHSSNGHKKDSEMAFHSVDEAELSTTMRTTVQMTKTIETESREI